MKNFLSFLLLLTYLDLHAQTIEIGHEAEYVKTVVEWSTIKQNKSNPLKKASEPFWTWDSKYVNGMLVEVSQCYQNQYLIDFKIKADYCEHYIMQNGILHYTIKEFKNISLEEITKHYREYYELKKIDSMFFVNGFEFYYKFYLNQSSNACVEYHRTNMSEWNKKMQDRFKTEKKIIEKKKTEELIKYIMQDDRKSYREKEIIKMKSDLENDKFEQKNDSLSLIKTKLDVQKFKDRKILSRPHPIYKCNEWGKVVVAVTVDSSGKVIDAKAGVKGTTNLAECLLTEAKRAALNTRWEPLIDSDVQQTGTIVYTFTVTD
jgi:hypothetical protein